MLLLAATASLAWALDIPTPTADQRVYKVPATWSLPVRAVTEAAGRTERKVWVVAYEQVIDGTIGPGRASETEDAIEQVWAAWEKGSDVFSPQQDALVLLGMDDREVRVRMGSEWDARFGLHNDKLLPLIDDNFLPRARADDYDGGLAALVTAVDGTIARHLRDEAAEAARKAEAEEKRAREAEVRAEEAARAAAEEEARDAAVRAAMPWAGGGLGLAGLGVVAGLRRRRAQAARAAFAAAVAERRARLDTADGTFASFRVDTELRDRIVELRLKGPVTTAAFREVSGTLDRIQVGLGALRQRLDALEAGVRAGPLDVAAWEAATAALDAPFSIETGRVLHRLFEQPNETVEIAPVAFMAALEADYATARAGWQRLLDAVEATLRRAPDDLPKAPYDALVARLDAAGLARAWADAHHLAGDADATWGALEAARATDPVAYLDALDLALEAAEEAATTVGTVIEGKAEAEVARARALAQPYPEDTVIDGAARDPAAVLAVADALQAALDRALAAPGDVEAADAAADAALDAWERLSATKEALTRTVATVAGALTSAEARVAELQQRFRAARATAQQLAGEHAAAAMGAVWREVQEAATDLQEAEAALAVAREALAARRHVAAEAAVERATREHGEALANLEQLNGLMAKLVAVKADVQRQLATLDDVRAGIVAELAGYGSFGRPSALLEGDQLADQLRAASVGGPVDWGARQQQLHDVLAAWTAAARRAGAAWRAEQEHLRRVREEEERQRRLAREAEERRRRAAESARQRSAYKSSFGSSGSSRASSPGRSGGSSFGGGGGRSAGRSFGGGGGRSGGRKF